MQRASPSKPRQRREKPPGEYLVAPGGIPSLSLITIVLFLLTAPSISLACPPSTFYLHANIGIVPTDTTVVTADPVAEFDHQREYVVCGGRSGFNIPSGSIYLSHQCGQSWYGNSRPELSVVDEFRVTGLPPGTPLEFTAVLEAASTGACLSGAGVTIAIQGENDDGISARSSCSYESNDLNGDLELRHPISTVADSTVRISFLVSSSGSSYNIALSSRFFFEDLPPGARVVSCKGYEQTAVQTLPTSWGRLKSIYR